MLSKGGRLFGSSSQQRTLCYVCEHLNAILYKQKMDSYAAFERFIVRTPMNPICMYHNVRFNTVPTPYMYNNFRFNTVPTRHRIHLLYHKKVGQT